MLAGRKLLLADDSATIQKVIDLTFADEGVRVMAVSNGREAIDRVLDFAPDIVLADVFMPAANGYEVCEYVKTNEKLKHIPVMLLVGSFEPFDEAEARRVGADDILTKPFSSIRRLIDRVGALVGSPPAEKNEKALEREGPTAELPRSAEPVEEPRLSTDVLEVTTADTMPLPGSTLVDTLPRVEQPVVASASDVAASEMAASVTPSARLEALLTETQSSRDEGTSEREGRMEPGITRTESDSQIESADVLLDLGDIEPAQAAVAESDEFILDLDDASGDQAATPVYEAAPVYESAPARAFVEPEVTQAPASSYEATYESDFGSSSDVRSSTDVYSPFAETQDVPREVTDIEPYEPSTASVSPQVAPTPIPDQLSPEMIDAIARRAVELMSDRVIREIAWEVVPDLAELLIKRQLEEKQAK